MRTVRLSWFREGRSVRQLEQLLGCTSFFFQLISIVKMYLIIASDGKLYIHPSHSTNAILTVDDLGDITNVELTNEKL